MAGMMANEAMRGKVIRAKDFDVFTFRWANVEKKQR